MAKLVISHVDFARVWFQVSYCMVRLLSSSPPPPLPPFFPLSLSVLFLSCTCVHTAVTHTSCASRSGNNTSDREGGGGVEGGGERDTHNYRYRCRSTSRSRLFACIPAREGTTCALTRNAHATRTCPTLQGTRLQCPFRTWMLMLNLPLVQRLAALETKRRIEVGEIKSAEQREMGSWSDESGEMGLR